MTQGVDVALGRRVDRLLVDDGAVVGVAVGDDAITAGAVVIAVGRVRQQPGEAGRATSRRRRRRSGPGTSAPTGQRGDHLDLAEQVGAQITGYDRGLRLLHANFATIYEAYLPGWLVLVNRRGPPLLRRDRALRDHGRPDPGAGSGGVRDLRPGRAGEATAAGVARYKQQVPGSTKKQSPHWNTDVVEAMVRSGRVQRADDDRRARRRAGVAARPPAGNRRPGQRVRATRARTPTTSRTRSSSSGSPRRPFYGAEVRPATVCFTACGLRIDRDARVLGDVGHADRRAVRGRRERRRRRRRRATSAAATRTRTASPSAVSQGRRPRAERERLTAPGAGHGTRSPARSMDVRCSWRRWGRRS